MRRSPVGSKQTPRPGYPSTAYHDCNDTKLHNHAGETYLLYIRNNKPHSWYGISQYNIHGNGCSLFISHLTLLMYALNFFMSSRRLEAKTVVSRTTFPSTIYLFCAHVPLRNYSLTLSTVRLSRPTLVPYSFYDGREKRKNTAENKIMTNTDVAKYQHSQ